MKFDIQNASHRKEVFAAARHLLKLQLRNRPRTIRGEKIHTLNDVYEKILGITVAQGKNWGPTGNVPPIQAIKTLLSAFPELEKQIDRIAVTPVEVEVGEYIAAIERKDAMIEELRAGNERLNSEISRLVRIIENLTNS